MPTPTSTSTPTPTPVITISDIDPFGAACNFVIDRLEGGEKQVVDRGGLTKWGISKKANPDIDIANLSREGAVSLYRSRYWDNYNIGALPPALALLVFDAGVNMFPPVAIRMLQNVLGVKGDGVLGAKTAASARSYRPQSELRALFSEIRLRHYEDLARNYPVHRPNLYGWRLRCFRVADEAGRWGG